MSQTTLAWFLLFSLFSSQVLCDGTIDLTQIQTGADVINRFGYKFLDALRGSEKNPFVSR
jgi:hypothetical protein